MDHLCAPGAMVSLAAATVSPGAKRRASPVGASLMDETSNLAILRDPSCNVRAGERRVSPTHRSTERSKRQRRLAHHTTAPAAKSGGRIRGVDRKGIAADQCCRHMPVEL